MKKMGLVLFVCLAGLAAHALDGPAEVITGSPKAAEFAKALRGRTLVCSPKEYNKEGDMDRYPLQIRATALPNGKTSITVANTKGEDGMSNCGCVVSRYTGDTLRLRDGDDDNYMDLKLKIDLKQLSSAPGGVTALDEGLDDSLKPWTQRELTCGADTP